MKLFERVLAALTALVALLTLLASCENHAEDGGNADGINISSYTVVRPDGASEMIVKVAGFLKGQIYDRLDTDIPVESDADFDGRYEILVGNTSREESTLALERLKKSAKTQAFSITATDKKIVIVGLSEDDTALGVKYFVNELVKTSESKGVIPIKAGYSYAEKTGKLLYFSPSFDALVLKRSSDIYHPRAIESSCTYGKIIKLEHNGENNGMLLATHETVDGVGIAPPVYCSKDDGKTWEYLTRVYDDKNVGYKVGYQSYIYELPADVGEYKEGTLLYSGCTRSDSKTIMVVYVSTDLGKTWKAVCNVDEGGGYNEDKWLSDGLWEPVLMYENGRLYCFYSDELENGSGSEHIGGHNQRLVYKYTEDMKTWSDKYECVASETPEHRPGMVSLTKMGNGKWALAYEVCNSEDKVGCQIYLKFADTLGSWDIDDIGKPVLDINGRGIGSAPAIVWTPNGGDCGTLLVTAHHSTGSDTGCDLFISYDYGKTFTAIDNPISVVRSSDKVRCGYSPGFFVDENGDVYYVNNPEAYRENERFAFVKIQCY